MRSDLDSMRARTVLREARLELLQATAMKVEPLPMARAKVLAPPQKEVDAASPALERLYVRPGTPDGGF